MDQGKLLIDDQEIEGTQFGLRLPNLEFKVQLNFVEERKVSFDKMSKPSPQTPTGVERIDDTILGLPMELANVIRPLEPRILSWLSKSKANRLAFFEDPVNALSQAGIKLDRSQQKVLLRVREGRLLADVLPGNVKIRTIILGAAKPPRHFSPNPSLPLIAPVHQQQLTKKIQATPATHKSRKADRPKKKKGD